MESPQSFLRTLRIATAATLFLLIHLACTRSPIEPPPAPDPEISITPTSLEFGVIEVGSTSQQTFSIKNTGGGSLTGYVEETCSAFSIISGGGEFSLKRGVEKTVTVQFEPRKTGREVCVIEVFDGYDYSHVDCGGTATRTCSLKVITPAAGTEWREGETHTITWDRAGNCDSVRIELWYWPASATGPGGNLSSDRYATTIAESVPNSGSYTWTVQDVEQSSHEYFVRIESSPDSYCIDEGEFFTVLAEEHCEIVVTQPAFDDIWTDGETRKILWDWIGICDSVRIVLRHDNGEDTIVESVENTGEYSWIVNRYSGSAGYNRYFVDVSCVNDPSCAGSAGWFTIRSDCAISVTSPAAGDALTKGKSHTVRWDRTGPCNTVEIRLHYSGSGFTHLIEDSVPDTGAYEWVVDVGPTGGCRIKVECNQDPYCYGFSGEFSVEDEECVISVTRPSSGDSWVVWSNQMIEWDHSGPGSSVCMELYKGGESLRNIICPTTDDGWEDWLVSDWGGGAGDDYQIKIRSYGDSSCYGYSDFFAIRTCSLVVTQPTDSTVWRHGSREQIEWEGVSAVGTPNVRLDLHNDSGWLCEIDPNAFVSAWWSVDHCGAGAATDYRIRVTCIDDTTCYVFSERFTIVD